MAKLIVDNKGGYFLTGIRSRYSGLFFRINEKMMKILDDNFSDSCSFGFQENKRIFLLSSDEFQNILIDIKESYDNDEFERYYEFDKEKNTVSFSKKYQGSEKAAYRIFLRFTGNAEIKTRDKPRWIRREYPFDKKRGSFPYERYVYSPFSFKGDMLVHVSEEKTEEDDIPVLDSRHKMSFCKKTTGLDQLIVKKEKTGIYAGLPWFFQFWSRDELISLKAVMLSGNKKLAKKIIFRNLDSIAEDGRLPNQTLPVSEKTNADAIGWLFRRIQDLQTYRPDERKKIISCLERSIEGIKKNYIKQGLVYNNPLETWMDTEWEKDNREGFRIEIQCLFLNMLKLAYALTRKKHYLDQEEKMKSAVREKFWNRKWLADGLDDFTKRPNVFIAAYVYPELLTKKEWETCFNNVLPALWLDWGGLSTIDMKHSLFTPEHTGETPKSYHRGDSWFWINSLAAIVMQRASGDSFRKYIRKIFSAGKKEFIGMGIKSQHAELSSASYLSSEGCPAQAWSDAMLAELVYELR